MSSSDPSPVRKPDAFVIEALSTGLAGERAALQGLVSLTGMLQRRRLPPDATSLVEGAARTAAEIATRLEVLAALAAAAGGTPTLEPLSPADLIDELQMAVSAGAGGAVLLAGDYPSDLMVLGEPDRIKRGVIALARAAAGHAPASMVEVRIAFRVCSGDRAELEAMAYTTGAGGRAGDRESLQLCAAAVGPLGARMHYPDLAAFGWTAGFTLELDRAIAPEAEAEIEMGDGPLPANTHILIVDDNATNRMVAAALCAMFGCTTETAQNGRDALEAVRARPFDLILMDIRMPVMDGVEATRAIRALQGTAGATPIVALTANSDEAAAAAYHAAGMLGVVEKPIKPQDLLAAIQTALGLADDDAPPLRLVG